MDCALEVVSKNSLPDYVMKTFFPYISSNSFIILHFMFRSTIHFMLISLHWAEVQFQFLAYLLN